MANSSNSHVIAFDIGGTKLLAGLVDSQGRTQHRIKQPVQVSRGVDAFVEQIVGVVKELESRQPEVTRVGIACAGPLDPHLGVLLDPTNFFTDGKSWGRVDLVALLCARLPELKFYLDNDAAAAVLAEAWLGHGREVENLLVMTLGTGVGVGVITNGQLVRSGRHLHPEASHISLNITDQAAPCGCGLNGCIEAYLSGLNFTKRMAKAWNEPSLSGEQLLSRAQSGEKAAVSAFADYGRLMAQAIHAFAVLFAPERVVLAGGFASASGQFLPTTLQTLEKLMVRRRVGVDLLPQVLVSQQSEDLGLLGAARVAFTRP